jgi:DNA-binding MarR family transcriptional regulator
VTVNGADRLPPVRSRVVDGPEADDGTPGGGPMPAALTPFLGDVVRRVHARSLECREATMPGDRQPGELAVLAAVDELGPASQRLLGDRLAINRTVMVQIVDRLEADGLVVRNRDRRDRRSYAVELSAAGRRALPAVEEQVAAHTDCLAGRLATDERRRLNELLRTLLATPEGGLAALPGRLRERTGFLVARARFVLRHLGREPLARLGIEPAHVPALVVLDDAGPMSQQRLAGELGVSGTIVVQLVDHLEDEGLVRRRRAPEDRRVHLLTVTSAGTRVQRAAREVLAQATAAATAPIGPEGAEELRALLLRLLGVG